MKKNIYLSVLLIICVFNLQAGKNVDWEGESFSKDLTTNTSFEENKGQVSGEGADRILFFHKDAGMTIFLMPTGIAYQFHNYIKSEKNSPLNESLIGNSSHESPDYKVQTYRMDMNLIGANPNAKITSYGESDDFTNYYHANAMNVHSYEKVVYEDIYPNIDWVVYKNESGIKYDFIVKPHGDPSQIKFKSEWVENIRIDSSGNLILENRMGAVKEKKPASFQNNKKVETSFVLDEDVVSFQLADYNSNETLLIDPDLIWGTYYGGEGTDAVSSVSTDVSGNVYICGTTYGSNFLASGGFLNNNPAAVGGTSAAYLVKFNGAGDRIWTTYYGGVGSTGGLSVAADGEENVYLSGFTLDFTGIASNGYQNAIASSGFSDGFLVKFNPAGDRIWATYFGGAGDDTGFDIAVDTENSVYLTGRTSSPNFPVLNASQATAGADVGLYEDAFLSKFDSDGVLLWSTYFGGSSFEAAFAVACASNGDVFISGRTNSNGLATTNAHQSSKSGAQDAFLVKYNTTGIRQWSTYYGGSEIDVAWGCTTDNLGNVLISGETGSFSGIAESGFQNTPYAPSFLVKFDSGGARLWGTYYGAAFGAGPGSANKCGLCLCHRQC